MLPTDAMNPALFTFFGYEGALTYQQERAGYSNRNFIMNCGSVFWFFLFYFAILAIYLLTIKLFKVNRERKWIKKIDGLLRYNLLLALVVEGFIELLFSAVIQVQSNAGKGFGELSKYSGELFGMICASVFLVRLYNFSFRKFSSCRDFSFSSTDAGTSSRQTKATPINTKVSSTASDSSQEPRRCTTPSSC